MHLHQENAILIVNRLLISFQHDQLQETHETQNAAQGGEWAQKVQSPEDSPQQGKNSYKLLLLFYTYYLITPLFKLLFLLPNFLGDLQTILVFCQDKHVDILLNIFFIPSGSTFTVSPTTTAGMLISLFNFNSNFALKIDHFYFRVVGIDSRGEDKDSTNCVICLTGDNLSLVTCHLWSVSQ